MHAFLHACMSYMHVLVTHVARSCHGFSQVPVPHSNQTPFKKNINPSNSETANIKGKVGLEAWSLKLEAWILFGSSTDLEPWQSKRWQKEVQFGHCCAACKAVIKKRNWRASHIFLTHHLIYPPKNDSWKFIQCWQLWQRQLWHNWRRKQLERRKYTTLIHVTSDRDALTSSRQMLSSMHPHRRPKDFISLDKEFLLEQLMTRPNATRRQIVTLIPARPFDRLS